MNLLDNEPPEVMGSLYQNTQKTSLNNLWKFVDRVWIHPVYVSYVEHMKILIENNLFILSFKIDSELNF